MNFFFLSFSYWFSLSPGPLAANAQRALSLLFAVVFIVGVVGKMYAKKRSEDKLIARVYRKIGNLGLTLGTLGFLMLFLFYEEVYLLNARFWFLFWILTLLVWSARIIYLARVKIPDLKKTLREQQEFEKYLPSKH